MAQSPAPAMVKPIAPSGGLSFAAALGRNTKKAVVAPKPVPQPVAPVLVQHLFEVQVHHSDIYELNEK